MPAKPDPDNRQSRRLGGDDGFPKAGELPFQIGGDDAFPLAGANPSKTCSLIDFQHFEVVPGLKPETWFLTVGGTLSSISIRASLCPVYYPAQPEYWEIEVIGCVPPIVLPVEGVFLETIPVTDTMGKKGIEVVGATKRETWQLPS